MDRRHVVALLVCAAIVYACAPRNRARRDDGQGKGSVAERVASTVDTAGSLAISLTDLNQEGTTKFALEVKNNGKRSEIRFANGKTHDFVVVDNRDREVWRWSSGRMFTQALQTKQLKTGDAVLYEATWSNARPGTYRVIAQLNRDTTPLQLEREFTVR